MGGGFFLRFFDGFGSPVVFATRRHEEFKIMARIRPPSGANLSNVVGLRALITRAGPRAISWSRHR